jgi:hypothetical protein
MRWDREARSRRCCGPPAWARQELAGNQEGTRTDSRQTQGHEAQIERNPGMNSGARETVEARLPQRIAARARDADPPPRRLRRRRGSAARRVHRGGRAVAAGGRAAEPARLAGLDRAASRRSTSCAAARKFDVSLEDVAERIDELPDPNVAKTTGGLDDDRCAWCSPAATRRSRPTRRWRSRCARSAASPPRRSRRPTW